MKKVIQIFLILLFLSMQSCGGKIEKSWNVKDFPKGRVFKLKAKQNKNHSSAIVLIEGEVDQDIYFRRNQYDKSECREFSKDTTFIKSRYDFYGGEFTYQLLPSQAKGEVTVTIELPYY